MRLGFADKNEEKSISLNLEKRQAILKEDKLFRDEMEKLHDEFLKHNFKSEKVLLDISIKKQKESELAHEGTPEDEKKDKEKDKKKISKHFDSPNEKANMNKTYAPVSKR